MAVNHKMLQSWICTAGILETQKLDSFRIAHTNENFSYVQLNKQQALSSDRSNECLQRLALTTKNDANNHPLRDKHRALFSSVVDSIQVGSLHIQHRFIPA